MSSASAAAEPNAPPGRATTAAPVEAASLPSSASAQMFGNSPGYRNSSATATFRSSNSPSVVPHYMLPHIVAVAMLAFAVLLLLTCTLLLCKIVVWSRRRRGVPADTQLSVASLRVVESALIESIASQTYGELLQESGGHAGCAGDAPEGSEPRSGAQSVSDSEADLCSVCLCAYETSETVRKLPCSHYFHAECLDPWMKRTGTCPSCRWSIVEWVQAKDTSPPPTTAEAADTGSAAHSPATELALQLGSAV
eukprot:jgi/Tetstr1/442128/TSEL_030282.t1